MQMKRAILLLFSVIIIFPVFGKELSIDLNAYAGLQGSGNCFNAGLISVGLWSSERYSYDEEVMFWLESPLCREKKWKSRSYGDLVLIYKSGKAKHVFTYLSDDSSFTKNGGKNFELEPVLDIFSFYGRKLRVFDCISWKEYIETLKLSENTIVMVTELSSIDEEISTRAENVLASSILQLPEKIEKITNSINQVENLFIKDAIRSKIFSIRRGLISALSSSTDDLDYSDAEVVKKIERLVEYSNH